MKTKIGIFVLALSTSFFNAQAQQRVTTTTRATSSDISDNLNLDAVASIFGESKNLEDFERRLNDPNNPISNLDLNEDGYIDYLRVVENSSDRNSLVVVQAVLDRDIYHDVATIEIERVHNGNPRIQIVGNSYIYGSNFIIEPVYYRTPIIFSFFWGPHYSTWHSPYYWNYYPRWYSHYRPCSPYKYHRHVYAHIDFDNKYRRVSSVNIHFSGDNYNHIRRNDYANRHPERSFEKRNHGINNRNELVQRRSGHSEGEIHRSSSNQNSDNRNYKQQQSTNEYHKPRYQEKSGTTPSQPREYNRNSNTDRRQSTDRQVQQNGENRNQTYERRSSTEQRSESTRQRSSQQVEKQQRSSDSEKKSGSVSKQSRSNQEVKQNQKSNQKTESTKKEDKKENENGRRR